MQPSDGPALSLSAWLVLCLICEQPTHGNAIADLLGRGGALSQVWARAQVGGLPLPDAAGAARPCSDHRYAAGHERAGQGPQGRDHGGAGCCGSRGLIRRLSMRGMSDRSCSSSWRSSTGPPATRGPCWRLSAPGSPRSLLPSAADSTWPPGPSARWSCGASRRYPRSSDSWMSYWAARCPSQPPHPSRLLMIMSHLSTGASRLVVLGWQVRPV